MVANKISVVKQTLKPELGPPNSNSNTPSESNCPKAIADTGTTGHFLALDTTNLSYLQNIKSNPQPIQVEEPSGNIITSTHTATIPWHQAPASACQGHLFPALKGKCLVSISQFADAGCSTLFHPTQVLIIHKGNVIIKGDRCPQTGLWMVPLSTQATNPHQANAVSLPTKVPDLVAFGHATFLSPSPSTFKAAIDRGHLTNHPFLTSANVKKHCPHSLATAKGHMDQTRAGQQSTQTTLSPEEEEAQLEEIFFPQPLHKGIKTHACYAATLKPFEATGQTFSDQTGKFPVTSSRGNAYIFVLYDYDSNTIHPVPIKNRTAESILEAYKQVHQDLVKAGCRPKLHRLDNECSSILKEYMHDEEIDFQLVPPGIHRRNAAERAIRTFKNHFIAGLCTADPDFPLYLWDRLIPQAKITLNLLRSSRINPKLSGYAQLYGFFDFNRTPPGTRIVVHEKPANRGTWAPHGVDAWYIGPAMEHYRCYNTYIWSTKAERISDTVEWFPHEVKMPTASTLDLLAAATRDILKYLTMPNTNSPLGPLSDSEHAALKTISEIFQSKTQASPASKPTQDVLRVDDQQVLRVATSQSTAPKDPVSTINPHAPAVVDISPEKAIITENPGEVEPPTINNEQIFIPQALMQKKKSPISTPPSSAIPITQETPEDDHYEYHGILHHRRALPRCGSKYEVQIDWTNHKPTWVPVNIFSDHKTNVKACETLALYAQQNNLLHTKGWKGYQAYLPVTINGTASLSIKQQNFFQKCYHLQQANKAINPDTGKLSEYSTLLKSSDGKHWEESCCEEVGRLAQGYPPSVPKGTDTMHFIRFDQIPTGRKATYLRLVVSDRPMKANPRRVRFTVGGDKVDYPGDVSTKTADLTTAKILFNHVLSTPDAKFMGIDIKDFYLNNPMDRYEYMRIPISQIPPKIIELYNLQPLIHNGAVYVEIRKGMYGLPQAGRIASDALVPKLNAAGYHQSPHVPGLFKHESRPVWFSLVVDDFGVAYVGKENAEHLIQTLHEANYKITTDWEGTTFCGITLKWDYDNRTVELSMPGYVEKALQRFCHPSPTKPEDSPHDWIQPNYGAKTQITTGPDDSPPLDPPGIKRLQTIIGTFLYYARAIDNTMHVALGSLGSAQSKGTKATAKAATKLLNYAATHPDAVIKFRASDMILHIHSDASYLSEPKARSRAGGFFYLSDDIDVTKPNAPKPRLNGGINILSSILGNVMASATEAEVGALFHNAQDACMIRNTLEFLGHKQPATPIQTDNACAEGIANDTVKQKRSKAIDMRFYWIRDRVKQGQFVVYWRKGEDNLADYFTKHHPTSHHRRMRSTYLHESANSLTIPKRSILVRVC